MALTGESLSQQAIELTQHWFDRVVLGLNLCPYAHQPAKLGNIRFTTFVESANENLLEKLDREAQRLEQNTPRILETTLIILPKGFEDFFFYLSQVEHVEAWLRRTGREGIFQVASFHPDYVFHGADDDDIGNLTNRSPFPVLHLLREESLEAIIDSGADTEAIPQRNVERLEALPPGELAELFSYQKTRA